MAGKRRLDSRCCTIEWNRYEIDALRMLEHFAGEMRRSADAGMGIAVLAVILLEKRNQLLDALCRNRRMHQQDVGGRSCQSNGRKILERIIRNFRIKARVDDVARADDRDCISIGRRARAGAHAEIPAGTRLILDIELLTEIA